MCLNYRKLTSILGKYFTTFICADLRKAIAFFKLPSKVALY
ncbi:hypothetical protein AVDCRST_MAG92-752 [uncultured Coleofasciculus sp.]|uniref:Uncharacterized protein n=1 Tax=uncultured Coleofasciculus sp. TaxID=1267456 RepID=A0A6J4HI97_9CYAN|nr:hypothetical protein AVDCRST_MAG92-752 [uncultured Coleofasciculus sp.]